MQRRARCGFVHEASVPRDLGVCYIRLYWSQRGAVPGGGLIEV